VTLNPCFSVQLPLLFKTILSQEEVKRDVVVKVTSLYANCLICPTSVLSIDFSSN